MIPETEITFAGGLRDRASPIRDDAGKVQALWDHPLTRVLPVWRGKPLFDVSGDSPGLGLLEQSHPIFAHAKEAPILLGLEGPAAVFAHDVSAWVDPDADDGEMTKFLDTSQNAHPDLPADHKFIDLRSIMSDISVQDAADAAMAKGAMEWHRTHQFCARCGHKSEIDQAGWRRRCPSCGAFHFPRTDPVVIMLILDGERALVGRQSFWPEKMYSLLAGFMEPGETIEAAVRRETMEEAGVTVGEVRYAACQPWPFPASLMIACVGQALTSEIRMDPEELDDAMWITKDDIHKAARGDHPKMFAARSGAIARIVLDRWANGEIDGFD